MANNVSNYLEIKGTDKMIDAMHVLFDICEEGSHADIALFCKTFYDEVETNEAGDSVMNSWTYDNVGTKWIYLENTIDTGRWNIQSANYTPKEFWIRLYEIAVKIDPEVIIEVQFEDESVSPVGAVVIKKYGGRPNIHVEENYDLEDPTDDKDWEDEDYDEVQEEFQGVKEDAMEACMVESYRMIDGNDGEHIGDDDEE